MNDSALKRPGQARPSKNGVPEVPSLPKLHCRAPLVTTELSKPIFKSTVGYDFDLSRPIEDELFRKYNALHDRHTKAFFKRPSMCQKLQKNGFVTSNMKVVCSLKEYNAYREFMECESMKLRKRQEESEKEKQALKKAVVKHKAVEPVEKEREEKRNKFFKDQEKKMARRQRQMRRLQRKEQQERMKAMEEKKLMRERSEIRREAEREQRRLAKLQQEHQEALEKRRQLRSSENQMLVRMLQLQHSRQSHRLQQIHELEEKWQAYDDHVHKAREEEEERKVRAKEEKERKRKRREKLVQLMKAKKEARQRKMHEQTFHHAEEHKKQADHHEKLWREKKEHEVVAWREKIHKEQGHWQHHLHHQMEVCKNDHQKQMDSMLHNSYLPKCAKSHSTQQKWTTVSSMSGKFSANVAHHGKNLKSKDAPKPKKKGVHFRKTASIHIIEEDNFEDDAEFVETCKQDTAKGTDISATKEDNVELEVGHDGSNAVESTATADEGLHGRVVGGGEGEGEEVKEEGEEEGEEVKEEGEEEEEEGEEEEEEEGEEQGASVSLESLKDIATGVADMTIQNSKTQLESQ